MNEAEEDVSDPGAIFGLVEQGVLPMQNGFLQCAFAQVIVEGRAWHPQESGELVPVFEHVTDGLAKGRVLAQDGIKRFLQETLSER